MSERNHPQAEAMSYEQAAALYESLRREPWLALKPFKSRSNPALASPPAHAGSRARGLHISRGRCCRHD